MYCWLKLVFDAFYFVSINVDIKKVSVCCTEETKIVKVQILEIVKLK